MSVPSDHRRAHSRGSLVPLPLLLLVSLALVASTAAAAETELPGPLSSTLPGASSPQPTTAPLRLVVNIPAFRLDVYENSEVAASYPVTVGKPTDPTPDGHYELKRVVWKPWWHPPGNRLGRDRVTPPGPSNPMGKVKLNFSFSISQMYFLHGTPKVREIGSPASRGCVRLRNRDAVALALLVHQFAVDPLPARRLAELASSRSWRTQEYPLVRRVPVDLVYELVEVRDGALRIYPDLYHQARFPLDELAARALEQAGYPRQLFDLSTLASRVTAAPGVVTLPLDQLMRPADEATVEVAGAQR